MSTIDVNGTTLYYERRGDGPTVLCISGATGDAGHWTGVADDLADEFTVITYDRRGNSRSPRPPRWTTTTIEEQADDAAALLRGLGCAPAIALGTSAAASIAADLALRHPDVLRRVVFHEPIFDADLPDAAAVRARRTALIDEGMARAGIRGAAELFLRGVAGDKTYEALEPDLRDRLLLNGDTLFRIEVMPFLGYQPTHDRLASMPVPAVVTAGRDNRGTTSPGHWRYQAARWLAARLHTQLVELPGAHMGYLSAPHPFAKALRPLLHPAPAATRPDRA
jgi:pimeloyl-ACP methyl ester carboxylesterase